ncbi:MAG: hypothetical protein JSS66_18520 [Armatimonadetes bacterium]|nr:hypothetical protein [Armatimonadota bacterium]
MSSIQISVGMADIKVAKGPAHFTCKGLGSSIGFVALDAATNVSGVAHLMLPKSFPGKPVTRLGQFVDTGVQALIHLMKEAGAEPGTTVVAYAGGAQVSRYGASGVARLDLGDRNVAEVAELVKTMGLKLAGSDIGGANARTLTVDTQTGEVKVDTATGVTVVCNLRRQTPEVAA